MPCEHGTPQHAARQAAGLRPCRTTRRVATSISGEPELPPIVAPVVHNTCAPGRLSCRTPRSAQREAHTRPLRRRTHARSATAALRVRRVRVRVRRASARADKRACSKLPACSLDLNHSISACTALTSTQSSSGAPQSASGWLAEPRRAGTAAEQTRL